MKFPHPLGDLFAKAVLSDEWYAKALLSALLGRELASVQQLKQERIETEDRKEKKAKRKHRDWRQDIVAKVTDIEGIDTNVFLEIQQTFNVILGGRLQRYYSFQYRVQGEGSKVRMHAILILGFTDSEKYDAITHFETVARDFKTDKIVPGPHDGLANILTHDLTIINTNKLFELEGLPISDLLFNFDPQSYVLDPDQRGGVIFKPQDFNMTRQQLLAVMHKTIENEEVSQSMLKDAENQLLMADLEIAVKASKQEAVEERAAKEEAQKQLAVSAKKLKAFGMSTTEIGEMLRLSDDEVEDLLK
jgi:hypothetical protein